MKSQEPHEAVDLRRILLVEDDRDIQIVVRMSLVDLGGYEVECCSSGEQALQLVPSFRPQLILLDVMMPNLDGISTLEALRELAHTSSTPVVFMTAKAQPEEISEYRRLGAADVIVKPFDPLTLSERIDEVWRRQFDGASVASGDAP